MGTSLDAGNIIFARYFRPSNNFLALCESHGIYPRIVGSRLESGSCAAFVSFDWDGCIVKTSWGEYQSLAGEADELEDALEQYHDHEL